jgi:hypothetical protein
MQDWWNLNSQKVDVAGIKNDIMVSSWACVVDVWWKKDFAPVRTGGANPETGAPFTYQAVGTTGDTIGVYIKNLSSKYDQGALLLRQTITTAGVNASGATAAVAQKESIIGTTNAMPTNLPIDYSKLGQNVAGPISFGPTELCDSTKWITSKGCYGMAKPWGISPITQYKPLTSTSVEVRG